MLVVAEAEKAAAGYLMWLLITLLLAALFVPVVVHLVMRRGTARQRRAMQRDRAQLRQEIDAWRESARRLATEPVGDAPDAPGASGADGPLEDNGPDDDHEDDSDPGDDPPTPSDNRGGPRT